MTTQTTGILDRMGPKGHTHLDPDKERTDELSTDLGFDADEIDDLFRFGIYPYESKLTRRSYEKWKRTLQIELLKVLNWVRETDQKIVLVFEGRDAAGKGGTIKRFMEHLNPRFTRIVALDKPTEEERGQWYFQRYVDQLPTEGEIVFFDRSWYNRAGVEPVMGFCTEEEHQRFLRQVPEFERMLVNSGLILCKYWFSVTKQAQHQRFESRKKDPLKSWKFSKIDMQSRGLWDEYTAAKLEMFSVSETEYAPWTIIKSDDKKRARLNCMIHFLNNLDYPDKNEDAVRMPDPLIVGDPSQMTIDS
ncbi:MAG: polyphosphate kinase 2 [Rhodothermales bacterium]|nr:polyphosphate kinase 2 [Rhodothermales bacterium]